MFSEAGVHKSSVGITAFKVSEQFSYKIQAKDASAQFYNQITIKSL